MPAWWCIILAVIEEIVRQIAAVTASPGFTWGDSGNVSSGSFLLNDTVPSNKAGRAVPLKDAKITKVFVTNEITNTFDVQILKRLGPGSFSVLTTISLTAQRKKVQSYTNVNVDEEDELAVRTAVGSCKNPVVGVIIVGSNI